MLAYCAANMNWPDDGNLGCKYPKHPYVVEQTDPHEDAHVVDYDTLAECQAAIAKLPPNKMTAADNGTWNYVCVRSPA
jgi:hypothetical protein